MKTFLVAALLTLTAPAIAGEKGGHGYGGGPIAYGGHANASAAAVSRSSAVSNASSSATAFGGQGGSVVNNVVSGGGGGRHRYPVSSAYAPGVAYGGGNVCGSQFSFGLSTFSIGASIGIPIEQTQCTYRENAYAVTRVTGSRTAGMLVLAQEPGMRSALAGAGLIVEPTYDDTSGQWVYPQAAYRRASYGYRRQARRSRCGRCD